MRSSWYGGMFGQSEHVVLNTIFLILVLGREVRNNLDDEYR